MKVRLSAHAELDLTDAHDHYATIDPGLGDRFLDDLDTVIERLEMFPDGAPPVDGFDGLRRARMRRFPFGLFYKRIAPSDLLVVRVLRTQRDHLDALDENDP